MLCLHLLDVGLQLLDSFRLGLLFHPVNPHFCVPMSGDKDFTNKTILNTNTLGFERAFFANSYLQMFVFHHF